MKVKVKICDVKTPEIAEYCYENSVDFIGLHQIYSPITNKKKELFNEIINKSGNMSVVLVTKIEDMDELVEIVDSVPFDYIQLHYTTTIEFVTGLKQHIMEKCNRKVGIIAVFQASDYEYIQVKKMAEVADYILFDSFFLGGTGVTISDTNIKKIKEECSDIKYFIAGGLNVDNVQTIIKKSSPFAVDVQSGVESNKNKDKDKIYAFVNAVQKCEVH